jgi:4-hydroxybenzoyl-CoA thioesterase
MNTRIYEVTVSFGDCDPAGIVFYPNILRWVDASFHNLLRPLGGHARMCEALQALGIGAVESSAQFLSPLRDGDLLIIDAEVADWGRKTLTLAYTGSVGERTAFQVKESRCLFMARDSGIVAAEVGALRAMMQKENS